MFAAAVLIFAREAGQVSRLLRGAPFAALGRWSYSIYMGHQIVLMVAVYGVWLANRRFGFGREIEVMIEGHAKTLYDLGGVVPSFALLAVILGVVIALAAFTYSRIEEPAGGRSMATPAAAKTGIGRAQAPASGPERLIERVFGREHIFDRAHRHHARSRSRRNRERAWSVSGGQCRREHARGGRPAEGRHAAEAAHRLVHEVRIALDEAGCAPSRMVRARFSAAMRSKHGAGRRMLG